MARFLREMARSLRGENSPKTEFVRGSERLWQPWSGIGFGADEQVEATMNIG
jgi:hypothetical protein